MTRSPSGRIVVKFDIELKRDLYACLSKEGKTLKEWFTEKADEYVRTHSLRLPPPARKPGGKA